MARADELVRAEGAAAAARDLAVAVRAAETEAKAGAEGLATEAAMDSVGEAPAIVEAAVVVVAADAMVVAMRVETARAREAAEAVAEATSACRTAHSASAGTATVLG